MSPTLVVGIWLLCGIGSAAVAKARGDSPVGAFFGGLMIPLALGAVVLVFGSALGVVWLVAS